MTFYNLPDVDAKIEFDKESKKLKITGVPLDSEVIWGQSIIDVVDGTKQFTVSLA